MKVSSILFTDDGDVPNHPRWPMIIYQGVIDAREMDVASAFETLFARHGWGNGWRNGIFAFPHYHSNAHEVLGIAAGEAVVRFGGVSGRELKVAKGDAVLLPAGTGHQRLSASADLLVIGAYPPGPRCDLKRAGESEKALIRERIRHVEKPGSDPLAGNAGPLISLWEA
ncbi:cupin domain-containing protein [Nordella sp. HKS 07]|uniref:cupin domain-containing protein n=1 Tax=Nordella sp. HKS 07 TaxID=2712222 RepID=UPI001FF039CC|nr:cupin domain-containing protein [Nordella sp. HKS 07]